MIKKERIVLHPGVYIKDAIEELGLNQSEFALRTGLSIKNVSTLINGESNITFDVAEKLSAFFANDIEGWVNLQTNYDLYKKLARKERELEEEWEIVKLIDKDFLSNFCDVDIIVDKEKAILNLRNQCRVGTLKALNSFDMYAFCKTCVKKDLSEKQIILRNFWISIAEKMSHEIQCSVFDKNKIVDTIQHLRRMTLLTPDEFGPKLKDFLASVGVKLVILPYLKGSNVGGVTKWNSGESNVMVAINDHGKDADKIWFSLFHELGHAIINHKRHLTISYDKDQIEDEEEKLANEFARNNLINPESYKDFVNKGRFDIGSINEFASQQQVANFIVIGRLQHDKFIPWTKFQNHKIKYTTAN